MAPCFLLSVLAVATRTPQDGVPCVASATQGTERIKNLSFALSSPSVGASQLLAHMNLGDQSAQVPPARDCPDCTRDAQTLRGQFTAACSTKSVHRSVRSAIPSLSHLAHMTSTSQCLVRLRFLSVDRILSRAHTTHNPLMIIHSHALIDRASWRSIRIPCAPPSAYTLFANPNYASLNYGRHHPLTTLACPFTPTCHLT